MAYRLVYTEFWQDAVVMEEMTPEDKYFYLYLLTNPNTNMVGIYQITKKQIAFELGYSIESVNSLIDRFEKHHNLIKYDPKTREIFIRKYAKYNLNKGGKPIVDCVKKELKSVKHTDWVNEMVDLIPNDSVKDAVNDFLKTGEIKFEPSKTFKPKDMGKISIKDYVLFRDNQTCFYTGRKLQLKDIEIDHINPKANGGTGEPSNLVVTSSELNNSKSAKSLLEFCEENDLNYEIIKSKINLLKEFEKLRIKNDITYRETIENDIHNTDDLINYITNRNYKIYDSSTNQNQNQNQNQKNEPNECNSSNEFKNLKLYNELGFGIINPTTASNILSLEEEYSEKWVELALKEADYNGSRKLSYVEGILKKWKISGVKSKTDKSKEETKQKELSLEEQILDKVSDFDKNNKPIGIIKAIIYNWINLYSIDSIYAAIEQCKEEGNKTMKRVKEILEG